MDKEIENTHNIEITNLDIAEKIALLASDYLKDEQMTVISTFDNSIDLMEIINQQTIFEFMPQDVGKILNKSEIKFLKSENLRTSICECLKMNDIDSFKQLSILLDYSTEIEKNRLKESISTVFAEEYSKSFPSQINEGKRRIFVSKLFDSLEILSEIWDM